MVGVAIDTVSIEGQVNADYGSVARRLHLWAKFLAPCGRSRRDQRGPA
jgi:hypothetical protein